MPGLFGVVDAASPSPALESELIALVSRMSAAMTNDPSDVETIVPCSGLSACVGRVSLADERMLAPVSSKDALIVVTAGEDAASVTGARTAGAVGEDIVRRLAGCCAAFVADRHANTCQLHNDRYGRERIFLHVDGARTFFASEAKAILAVAPKTRRFDREGLAELLACGCTLGSRSLFHEIEVLEPGTLVTFERGGCVRRRRYFTAGDLERLERVEGAEFIDGFTRSLSTAVNRIAGGPTNAGVSVTGGLDSRMIMASLMAPLGSVPCYTFGSMYRTTADVAVGRQVASCCGQPHRVIELGHGFLSELEPTFERSVYASDGYLGLSGAAELYVNQQARGIAPVRMTGNWGGELMRGVRAFKYAMPKGDFIVPELAAQMTASAAKFSTTSRHPLSAALFQQVPYQGYGRYAIERSQVAMRSPFLTDDVVRWLYRAPAAVRESEAAVAVIGRRPDLLALPTDLGLLGSRPSFGRRALRRVIIKAEYMTSHGAPDWLARLSATLPSSVLETRFLGTDKFQHFRFWMRHQLADFVRDTLTGHRDASEWFDTRRVGQMVTDHIDGRANYTDEIDKLMTVAVAGKVLLRQPAPAASERPRVLEPVAQS